MTTATKKPFFGTADATELLDLVLDETAGSLALVSDFQLGEALGEDRVTTAVPGVGEDVRIAFRFAFRGPSGTRIGLLQMSFEAALVLAGALLMHPTSLIRGALRKSGPDDVDKEAIMEAGRLVGGAFDAALHLRFDGRFASMFAGCQGVAAGEAAWLPNPVGESLAVRRHRASFRSFEPFEIVVAIPV